VLLSILAVGCAPDPLADCISVCNQGIDDGCVNPQIDCRQTCLDADVAAEYDEARAIAKEASCVGAFDDLWACQTSGEVCDPTRCLMEIEAYLRCMASYCASHSATFCR